MIERFVIQEGLYDPGIFKAFFLAGGPGSGKSYVTSRITPGLGLKNVNSDTAFETALKKAGLSLDMPASQEKERDEIRARSKRLTAKRLDLYIMGRLGLVIDSTARDVNKIETGLSALKRLGYDCYMIFVNTSLDVALARNAARDRTVPVDIVKKSHKQIQQNMGKLQRMFGMKNFIVIDNNKANENVLDKSYKMVRKIVKRSHKQIQQNMGRLQRMFGMKNFIVIDNNKANENVLDKSYKMVRKIVKRPIGNHVAKMWLRKELEKRQVREDINIPIKVGDVVKGGKFKNKSIKVKKIGKNEKGDITINDKPLLKVRIPNENN